MTLTEALVNSLGPWVIEPSGFTSFLVFRVRKPWSFSQRGQLVQGRCPGRIPLEHRLDGANLG